MSRTARNIENINYIAILLFTAFALTDLIEVIHPAKSKASTLAQKITLEAQQLRPKKQLEEKDDSLPEIHDKYYIFADLTAEKIEALETKAYAYSDKGDYANEAKHWEIITAWRKNFLEDKDPKIPLSINNLAAAYYNLGLFSKAESLYKEAVAINKKILGPEHPYIATSLNNLAVLYNEQGLFGEAESLHKRSLAIREKTLGAEHQKQQHH